MKFKSKSDLSGKIERMEDAYITVPHPVSFKSYREAHEAVQTVMKDFVQPTAQVMLQLWHQHVA